MAEKRTVELEIKDNSKSLKAQYKEAVAELQKVSAQYGETSKQAINAAKAAAELKDQIAFSKDLVSSFNPDAKFDAVTKSIGGALNGFQAYEGAMGLIGVENENLQKTMLKVQSAMALSQGIQGIGEAKDSFVALGAVMKSTAIGQAILTAATAAYNFVLGASTTGLKLFRLALISTGIGALVVGVGLLVANFDSIVNVVKKVVGWFSGLSDTTKNILSVIFPFIGAIRLVVAGLEALGVVDDEQAAIKKKNHENDMKRADAELKKQAEVRKAREKTFNSEQSGYDRAIKLAQAEGKSVIELQKQKINASIKYQETRQKEIQQDLVALKLLRESLGDFGAFSFDETIGEMEAKINELGNNILDQKNDLKILDIEASKPAASTGGGGGGVTPQQQTDIDVTRKVEDEKLRIKDESRQKELDALDIKYKRQKEDAQKELANDKDKVNKLAALNAQAVESRKFDEKTINDKYDKIEKDAAIKKGEELIKIQDEQYYALQKLKNSQQEQELLDLQIAYDKEYEAALNNTILQTELTNKFNKDSAVINKKYSDEKKAADQKLADEEIARTKAVAEQKQAIQNQGIEVALQGVQLIKNVFEKSKGVQKAAVIAESAIGIAKMIISNKLANAGALATPQAIASSGAAALPVIALNNISTGIGIAANIAATAKALNSLGGGSAPNAPGTGGGGGGGGGMTAQFNTVGNNGINQLAQLQQQPTMAYVVSGQVTSQQALDRNRQQNSSL